MTSPISARSCCSPLPSSSCPPLALSSPKKPRTPETTHLFEVSGLGTLCPQKSSGLHHGHNPLVSPRPYTGPLGDGGTPCRFFLRLGLGNRGTPVPHPIPHDPPTLAQFSPELCTTTLPPAWPPTPHQAPKPQDHGPRMAYPRKGLQAAPQRTGNLRACRLWTT